MDKQKCSYFQCNEDAIVSIPRARQFNCQTHWETNLLKFRCPDMFEALPPEPPKTKER